MTGSASAPLPPPVSDPVLPATLVLASTSPRRLELLGRLGLVPDRIAAPDIDETPHRAERPRAYVERIARAKAAAVPRAPGEVILAADTTIAAGPRLLGKPADVAEARAMLRLLSGRRHHCLSAVCAIDAAGTARLRLVDTLVAFRPLTTQEIDAYLATDEWAGKAGAYAIQGRAEAFVRFLHGSHSGVVGLPLAETRTLLRAAGIALA